MKKLLWLTLLLAALAVVTVCLLPAAALALNETFEANCGGVTVTFKVTYDPTATENGKVQVGNGMSAAIDVGTSGTLTLPNTVNNPAGNTYTVTAIGDRAFLNCASLENVVMPNGVTAIGYRAFYGCANLTGVALPSGLISIGQEAFRGCASLQSVALPSGVTSIEPIAFVGCSKLSAFTVASGNSAYVAVDGVLFSADRKTLVCYPPAKAGASYAVPDTVTGIEHHAFRGCVDLTDISLPDGLDFIGDYAFSYCSGLTRVELPNSVTYLGGYAFLGCTGLKSVALSNQMETIYAHTFRGCTSLESVDIPNGISKIETTAFQGCASLTSVVLPSSVREIESYAFRDCTSLAEVCWLRTDLSSLNNLSFSGIPANCKLYYPVGSQSYNDDEDFGHFAERIPAYFVTATASAGGAISPAGVNHHAADDQPTYAITPDAGSFTTDVQVDGASVGGGLSSYTFVNLPAGAATRTLHAEFAPIGFTLNPADDATFPTADVGYGAQTPHAVTVKNTSTEETGDLTVALSGANADAFALSATTIASLPPAETSDFTVAPNEGLSIGTYAATVTVSRPNGASLGFDVSFTVAGKVVTPVANPPAGTYPSPQTVALTCATPGATIRYTTDGTEPDATSDAYAAPIPVNASVTLRAKAFLTGWTDSATLTAAYSIQGKLPCTLQPNSFQEKNATDVVFTIGAGMALTPGDLADVTLNGRKLSPVADYAVASGSIVVTVRRAYLNTLKPGAYTLRATMNDGAYAEAKLTVVARPPATGDGGMPGLWLALCLLSGAGVALAAFRRRRGA